MLLTHVTSSFLKIKMPYLTDRACGIIVTALTI
nr:MAG TPA: hypothetical protein [Caudoviricetes sp.]